MLIVIPKKLLPLLGGARRSVSEASIHCLYFSALSDGLGCFGDESLQSRVAPEDAREACLQSFPG